VSGSPTEEAKAFLARLAPQLLDQPIVERTLSIEKTVWAVGVDHVLRRATRTGVRSLLQREHRLLRMLAGRTTLSVPRPVCIAPDGEFDLLRRALGQPADHHVWPHREPSAQRDIARQLGRFLAELHDTVDVEEAESLGFAFDVWPPSPAWVEERLAGRMETAEREALLGALLRVAPRLYEDTAAPVLLHDDFSHHNVGFSPDGRMALGVFDFTEARLGDPHRDLRYAYTFEPFAEVMIGEYEARRGVVLDRSRVRAWHAWSALGALAWELHDGVPERLALRWGWVDQVAAWGFGEFEALCSRY